jgi:hypothetical protein
VGESGRRKLFSLSVEKKDSRQVRLQQDNDSPKVTLLSIEMFESNPGANKYFEHNDEADPELALKMSMTQRLPRDDYIVSADELALLK